MNFQPTLSAQRKKWTLRNKLGEGDAGEVYLVEALLDSRPAILKRPRREAYMGDVLRQASQIRSEAQVLRAVEGMPLDAPQVKVKLPLLLDQSLPQDGVAGGFFIVIERADGLDLSALLRIARSGTVQAAGPIGQEALRRFARSVAASGIIPGALIVRVFLGVLHLLDVLHRTPVRDEAGGRAGLIWNDVKPEHLFWEPAAGCLSVIDWGNAAFLESGGASLDRQHTQGDDFAQYLHSLGSFLQQADPDLYARLAWPGGDIPAQEAEAEVKALKMRLVEQHAENQARLHSLREQEGDLYALSKPGIENLKAVQTLHAYLLGEGEIPDYASAENLAGRAAMHLSAPGELAAFQRACEYAAQFSIERQVRWMMLAHIAELLAGDGWADDESRAQDVAAALAAGAAGDWADLLWGLLEACGEEPLPAWWEEVSADVRRHVFGLDEDALPPHIAVHRLYYTLQNTLMAGNARREQDADLDALKELLHDEAVVKWRQIAPDPPHSGIGYEGVGELIARIGAMEPEAVETIERILDQPRAQASIALHAWDQKDFETARRALRGLLVWDPARRRLMRADRAIRSASAWLGEVRRGAQNGQPFHDYLASAELNGRKLRSQVGPAEWLDAILEALKRLRKGERPADLLMEHAHLGDDLPWLNEFRSREVLSLPRSRALSLERDDAPPHPMSHLDVEQHVRLGPDGALRLGEPLDTWSPEARGSSARVFAADLLDRQKQPLRAAFKVMRPDATEYALPLFKEEAAILAVLRDLPGITPLVECGFIKLDEGQEYPRDDGHTGGQGLSGSVERFRAEQVQNYLALLENRTAAGWLPYLAFTRREHAQNLLKYCDAGATRGWFLPLQEGLLLSIQILDILQAAHERSIVYRDHKILHYYWHPETHGVVMIDWNIARRHPQGLSEAEVQFDLVQFGARALHHILTGRPAPGALPLGPNRPEEIEQASTDYRVSWTYDDERLPERVKEILTAVLSKGYTRARDLRADLAEVYRQIPGVGAA